MAPPPKPRWRFHVKPHPAPRRAGPLACNKRVGVQLFLASARAKQLGASPNATPKKSLWRSVSATRIRARALRSCQNTAARLYSKHHSRGAPWEATTLIRRRADRLLQRRIRVVVGCSRSRGSCERERASGRHPRHCAMTAPRSKAHTLRTKRGKRVLNCLPRVCERPELAPYLPNRGKLLHNHVRLCEARQEFGVQQVRHEARH